MRNNAIFSVAMVAAFSALMATPSTARGHTWRVGPQSFNVHVDDLDLKTAGGRETALRRVEQAAGRLCQDIGVRRVEQACATRIVEKVAAGPLGSSLKKAMANRAAIATLAKAD